MWCKKKKDFRGTQMLMSNYRFSSKAAFSYCVYWLHLFLLFSWQMRELFEWTHFSLSILLNSLMTQASSLSKIGEDWKDCSVKRSVCGSQNKKYLIGAPWFMINNGTECNCGYFRRTISQIIFCCFERAVVYNKHLEMLSSTVKCRSR